MVKQDQLWPGGFRFFFDDGLFQPGTDSFLLGSFPRLRRGARVCDLGAGTGLLGLLLLAREPSLQGKSVRMCLLGIKLVRNGSEPVLLVKDTIMLRFMVVSEMSRSHAIAIMLHLSHAISERSSSNELLCASMVMLLIV